MKRNIYQTPQTEVQTLSQTHVIMASGSRGNINNSAQNNIIAF